MAGLSAPSRLHDLFVTFEAITPGQHRSGCDGLTIFHGVHAGPFGDFAVGATDRGICSLEFLDSGGPEAALAAMLKRFPGADLKHMPERTEPLCRALFDGPDADPRRPPAALVPRHEFPDQGVGGAALGAAGRARHLSGSRRRHRRAVGGARRGQRGGGESDRRPHSLPSRYPGDGTVPHRLQMGGRSASWR